MVTIDIFRNEKDLIELQAGDVLFSRGDEAHEAYVIISGSLEILVDNILIDVATEGGIVGEMALIDDAPRSATVRAQVATTVAKIDENRFAFLVQQTPFFALKVMRIMSERLRNMLNSTTHNN